MSYLGAGIIIVEPPLLVCDHFVIVIVEHVPAFGLPAIPEDGGYIG